MLINALSLINYFPLDQLSYSASILYAEYVLKEAAILYSFPQE